MGVLICTGDLTLCSYHVAYAFQSESTLYILLNVREPLSSNRCDIWSLSGCIRLESTTTFFTNKQSTIWRNWPNNWAELRVLICSVHLTVCSYHITYCFHSESTLYICPNVKELFAQKRRDICSLIDCNGAGTQSHLFHKRTFNHLAKITKWLRWVESIYLFGVFDFMFLF